MKAPTLLDFVFDYFNEKYPDEMGAVIEAYKKHLEPFHLQHPIECRGCGLTYSSIKSGHSCENCGVTL